MPPPSNPRPGPRPLALHLGAALAASSARPAWPAVRAGLLPWSTAVSDHARLTHEQMATADGEAFDAALDTETRRRADAFLTGIETYRSHPYSRALPDAPVLWQEGTTRLLDYGMGGPGPAVLVIPSLVNRFHVLDLTEESSLLRDLAREGIRPLLVDWDAPGDGERGFSLTDYVAGRLSRALDAAVDAVDGPVPVIGYCMGGLLALALAQLRPGHVNGFVALATPWDFHADYGGPPPLLASLAPQVGAVLDMMGEMPVDMLQAMFFALDPMQGWVKFRHFARLRPDSPEAARFVALEDWANDGVPLAGPVARECLIGWYLENSPARGAWRIAGEDVRPATLKIPALVVVPERDRIVPPASARALAEAIPGAERITPASGHVGMVTGTRARDALWRPLAAWIRSATGP